MRAKWAMFLFFLPVLKKKEGVEEPSPRKLGKLILSSNPPVNSSFNIISMLTDVVIKLSLNGHCNT